VICPYTLDIKTPMQPTTLNVKGAACDLFDASIGINHQKCTPFAVLKGSFATVKRVPCNRPLRERMSWKLKSKHVSPVTVFFAFNLGSFN